ncbi:hypothetical protein MMMB2_3769 [Mycobacterium marinum MB2]|nr:hypothetical protein MMMB2_3769 [Mycobacterium marinum MB2]
MLIECGLHRGGRFTFPILEVAEPSQGLLNCQVVGIPVMGELLQRYTLVGIVELLGCRFEFGEIGRVFRRRGGRGIAQRDESQVRTRGHRRCPDAVAVGAQSRCRAFVDLFVGLGRVPHELRKPLPRLGARLQIGAHALGRQRQLCGPRNRRVQGARGQHRTAGRISDRGFHLGGPGHDLAGIHRQHPRLRHAETPSSCYSYYRR